MAKVVNPRQLPDRQVVVPQLNLIAGLIGSVDGLPADLSRRKKSYLKAMGYGKKPAH